MKRRGVTRQNTCVVGALLASMLYLGCSVTYSFSGASISPDSRTVSVSTFQNIAPLINPQLASALSEKLRERLQAQTPLSPVEYSGDLHFEGEITGYGVVPTAIQSNETAAQNRLTVVVAVRFTNAQDPTADFEKSFTAYEDFPATQAFAQVEQSLCEAIMERLVDEIFNAAVANW